MAGVYAFFAKYVFGPDRRQLLAEQYQDADGSADTQRQQRIESVGRRQDDIATRRRRLIRSLELTDDPDVSLQRGELVGELFCPGSQLGKAGAQASRSAS